MSQKIGLVYDLRSDYLAEGFTEEDVAEFDSEGTITALEATIMSLGYVVVRIGNARRLCERLVRGERWDMIFNIAEGLGGRCREAQVPALLELFGVPYTFSDPLVCAATLDKAIAKRLVAQAGLRTPPFAVVRAMADVEAITLRYPLFAKPLAEGTGKGIDQNSRIDAPEQLKAVCAELLDRYRQPVLVEEYLPGREFTVGVVGTAENARVIGTMEIEMRKKDEPAIYSYVNKEECASRIVYHPITDDMPLKAEAEQLALDSFRELECRDGGRVDLRCDADGRPCFIEVNPLAGLHPTHSDLPMIATQEGMPYPMLIKAILDSAFARVSRGVQNTDTPQGAIAN
ncbi:MAG: ATP-grasp domain-containing protein [Phycisphaerae bacterium]|jgi:D-alanine-D-alanine ligase|nr:ATP-grasp domain-containing protein [Phycisphaerae bacterium]